MKRRVLTCIITACVLLCITVPVRAEVPSSLYVERQVYQFLTEELGLNSAAACGVLANIEHESAFDLTVVGDYGTSFGLCQWHNGRYASLIGFCGGLGLDYRTVEGQMTYLSYELKTGYYSVLSSLRHVENSPEGAYRAGYLWCVQFERPANAEQRGIDRGTTAQYKYWNRYNNNGTPAIPSITLTDMVSNMVEESSVEAPVVIRPVPSERTEEPVTKETVSENEAAAEGSSEATPNTQRRFRLRPFPVRHFAVAAPKQPEPDYATGFAVGLSMIPMGDGRKMKLIIPVPEEEPATA